MNVKTKALASLSETRKADREEMSRLVAALCEKHGVPCSIEDNRLRKNSKWVMIESPDGLALSLDFSGGSCQPNVFVLSWHMEKRGVIISRTFCHDRNTVHFRKATDICRGMEELLEVLDIRLGDIANGSATESQ